MHPLMLVSALTFTRNRGVADPRRSSPSRASRGYTPRNEFEERYAYYPAPTVEMIRNEVTMGALKGAAVRLGGCVTDASRSST